MDYRGIEQHGNGIRITVQHQGKRHRRFLDKPWSVKRNRAEAQRVRDDLKYRLRNNLPPVDQEDHANPTFFNMCETYLKSLRGKPSTLMSYEQCLNRYWVPHLGEKHMLHLTYREVLDADLSNQWSGAKTRKNAIGALRGVFSLAQSTLDGFNVNFAGKLPRQTVEKKEVRPFSADEKASILDALAKLDQDACDYFTLGFELGCRLPGELNALCWRHYHQKKYVTIQQAIARRRISSTKTHAERKVYLTPEAVAVLERRPRAIDGGFIFRNNLGGHHLDGDVMNGWWRKAIDLANTTRQAQGMPLIDYRRAYNCRHTRATLDLMAGGKPAFLASQLGHTLDQFFSNYATWIKSKDDEAEMATILAGRSQPTPEEAKR